MKKEIRYFLVHHTIVDGVFLKKEIAAFSSKKIANKWKDNVKKEMDTLSDMLRIGRSPHYREATQEEIEKVAPTMWKIGFTGYNPNVSELIIVDKNQF